MHTSKVAVGESDLGDRGAVAGDEVDDARRHARGLEQLHQVVRREHRARRRLPHHGIPHQRWGSRQVCGDRREVERRDGVNEPFECAVLQAVPCRVVAERLLGTQFLREVRIEAPEVDDLACRIDLCLKHGLRLSKHRRRVDGVSPRHGEQLRGSKQHRSSILERPARPLAVRGERRVDRLVHQLRRRFVKDAEHVLVIVWHHGQRGVPRADLCTADHERYLDLLERHCVEPRLQGGALRGARRVGTNRFVDRRGQGHRGI